MRIYVITATKYRIKYNSKLFEIIVKDGRYWLFLVKPSDIRPLVACSDKFEELLPTIKGY
jgi:hypothetical protein